MRSPGPAHLSLTFNPYLMRYYRQLYEGLGNLLAVELAAYPPL